MLTQSDSLTLARSLLNQGSDADAVIAFKRHLEEFKGDVNALVGLSAALNKLSRLDELEALAKANPDVPEVAINAGLRLANVGREQDAIAILSTLIGKNTQRVEPGLIRLFQLSQATPSAATLAAGMALMQSRTEDAPFLLQVAEVAKKLKELGTAITIGLKALECATDVYMKSSAKALLAGFYKDQAQMPTAMTYFSDLADNTATSNTISNAMMSMQYCHLFGLKEFYARGAQFSRLLAPRISRRSWYTADYTVDRPIRIGFASGDFCLHSLYALLYEPFREMYAIKGEHTLIAYSNRASDDSGAESYKKCFDIWRDTSILDDDAMLDLIASDKVDVLIDIAGHTAHNRLPVFAKQAAPCQMGWVSGMMTPPALDAVKYFISDKYLKPRTFSGPEKLYELTNAFCYKPVNDHPEVGELPALRNGYISFGTFNNPCKINDEVLAAWAGVLLAVPNSKMHIKLYAKGAEARTRQFFRKFGLGDERIVPVFELPGNDEVLAYYNKNIDIFLDAWPCAGCLTTVEAISMGVPVVTKTGETFVHRQSHAILANIGLPNLVANTQAEYIKIAETLAKDTKKLSVLRASLRTMLHASVYSKPELLARGVLDSIEDAWSDTCAAHIKEKQLCLL